MPEDAVTDSWFQKYIAEKLDSLTDGQATLNQNQQKMHESNQSAIDTIKGSIVQINLELSTLKLAKQVVFVFIGMVLVAVFGAWIALVVIKH